MTPTPEDIAAATRRWPGVELTHEQLLAAWTRLSDTVDGPNMAHLEDLCLAVACATLQPTALEHLRRLIRGLLPRLHGFNLDPAQLDALEQDTLTELTTQDRLRRYAGRGSLEGWLLVVLGRRAYKVAQAARAAVEFDDVLLGDLATDNQPELELLKQRFRGLFSEAFRAAIARLTVRQRNLLRQHYLDQLSLDELGLLYRSHRSTVARWLADARTSLLDETRTQVSERLGVGRHEVDSLMRAMGSRLDLSAGVFLGSEPQS